MPHIAAEPERVVDVVAYYWYKFSDKFGPEFSQKTLAESIRDNKIRINIVAVYPKNANSISIELEAINLENNTVESVKFSAAKNLFATKYTDEFAHLQI